MNSQTLYWTTTAPNKKRERFHIMHGAPMSACQLANVEIKLEIIDAGGDVNISNERGQGNKRVAITIAKGATWAVTRDEFVSDLSGIYLGSNSDQDVTVTLAAVVRPAANTTHIGSNP